MADERGRGELALGRPGRRSGRAWPPGAVTVVGALLVLGLVAGGAALAWRPVRALNLLAGVRSHHTASGVRYGPAERQRFDLYQPSQRGSSAPFPLVVFVYGGSWNRGERGDYRFVGEALAARGIAAMVIDYRLYPEVTYPTFLQDTALGVAWALDHAGTWGADPRRVFVMGHSAGGYNAAMMALDPRWLAATGHQPAQLAGWIGLAGPYDFLPIHDPEVKPVFHAPDVAPDTQPMAHARAAVRPLPAFLAAPEQDSLVNPDRSTSQLAGVLRERGGAVVLHRYPGVNHGTLAGAMAWPLTRLAPVRDDVVRFVRETPAAQ